MSLHSRSSEPGAATHSTGRQPAHRVERIDRAECSSTNVRVPPCMCLMKGSYELSLSTHTRHRRTYISHRHRPDADRAHQAKRSISHHMTHHHATPRDHRVACRSTLSPGPTPSRGWNRCDSPPHHGSPVMDRSGALGVRQLPQLNNLTRRLLAPGSCPPSHAHKRRTQAWARRRQGGDRGSAASKRLAAEAGSKGMEAGGKCGARRHEATIVRHWGRWFVCVI